MYLSINNVHDYKRLLFAIDFVQNRFLLLVNLLLGHLRAKSLVLNLITDCVKILFYVTSVPKILGYCWTVSFIFITTSNRCFLSSKTLTHCVFCIPTNQPCEGQIVIFICCPELSYIDGFVQTRKSSKKLSCFMLYQIFLGDI